MNSTRREPFEHGIPLVQKSNHAGNFNLIGQMGLKNDNPFL
jgi:hypothetical protein